MGMNDRTTDAMLFLGMCLLRVYLDGHNTWHRSSVYVDNSKVL
jgi:hypothetical protein